MPAKKKKAAQPAAKPALKGGVKPPAPAKEAPPLTAKHLSDLQASFAETMTSSMKTLKKDILEQVARSQAGSAHRPHRQKDKGKQPHKSSKESTIDESDNKASSLSESEDSSSSKSSKSSKDSEKRKKLARSFSTPSRKEILSFRPSKLAALDVDTVVQIPEVWTPWVMSVGDMEEQRTRSRALTDRIANDLLSTSAGPKVMGSAFHEAPVLKKIIANILYPRPLAEKMDLLVDIIGARSIYVKIAGDRGLHHANQYWKTKSFNSLLDPAARKIIRKGEKAGGGGGGGKGKRSSWKKGQKKDER
jgi:hypothetical protein